MIPWTIGIEWDWDFGLWFSSLNMIISRVYTLPLDIINIIMLALSGRYSSIQDNEYVDTLPYIDEPISSEN